MDASGSNSNFRLITTRLFFVFYFLYFMVFNRYHLIYQEQTQLFRFDLNYFTDFLSRPGGLMEYASAFLTQLFLFPFAGASIVTLAGLSAYAITVCIFRKHQVTGVIWAFIPTLLLAALHSHYLYNLAYTLGLIVSLGYFAVYISIRNNKLRFLIMVPGWLLLYFFTGGYALLAILLCLIHELFFRPDRSSLPFVLIFPILALLVPYLASHLIFYIKPGMAWTIFLPLFIEATVKHILILLLVYYPIVLVVSKMWLPRSNKELLSPGRNWITILTGTIVIVCLSGLMIKYVYDRKAEILLGMDHCIQNSDWDGALKLSSAYPGSNRLVMYFTNLALYKSGHMGNQLFHYPQTRTNGLWLDWEPNEVVPFFGGELYYHLAYNSEAYRWAFEAMIAKGPNPRSLKRLAVTSLVNGDIKLAEKYLNVLNQSLFYRRWAQHYLLYINSPERIREDKEIAEKSHFKISKDLIGSRYNFGARLPQILSDHPDNRMAFEYFMASMLLNKNLGDFAANIYRIKELGYNSIPVHYEEAMLAFMSYTKKNIIPEGYAISVNTHNRFSEYANKYVSFGDKSDLAARSLYGQYGKTYWFYLHFINKNLK
jgi:hypothetical protein